MPMRLDRRRSDNLLLCDIRRQHLGFCFCKTAPSNMDRGGFVLSRYRIGNVINLFWRKVARHVSEDAC